MTESGAWIVGLVAGVVVLFAVLYWLSANIEPDERKTDNDEHMKHGD